MKARIVFALLLSISVAGAQDSTAAALDRLAKVSIFAFGGVGYAGVRSRGEAAYRIVLARPSALADFERLLTSGTPEARLYALVGIRTLELKRFDKVVRPFRESKEDVTMRAAASFIMSPLT